MIISPRLLKCISEVTCGRGKISPSTDILYSLALFAETVKFTTPVPSPFGIVAEEPTTTFINY